MSTVALFSRVPRSCACGRRAAVGCGSTAALFVAHGQPRQPYATARDAWRQEIQSSSFVPASERQAASSRSNFWAQRLGPADAPAPDNVFLRILEGTKPADVVDNDGDLFSFRDIRPASRLHLLVIPKRFVRDASMLAGPDDAELVRRMQRKAIALVRAELGADAFDAEELVLGFHMPPWYSVPWLHLHAIYPRREMTRRYKYTPFSFYPPERILEGIESKR